MYSKLTKNIKQKPRVCSHLAGLVLRCTVKDRTQRASIKELQVN